MKNILITNIEVENVRHLKNITIPLSKDGIRHLIFTGKNGSGKTSVLCAMSKYLNQVVTSNKLPEFEKLSMFWTDRLHKLKSNGIENDEVSKAEKTTQFFTEEFEKLNNGVAIQFNETFETILEQFEMGQFVLAYYKAERTFEADIPKHVEKIDLKQKYFIDETPRTIFVKYLLDLKMTEALARSNGKTQKADEIKQWFDKLQDLLRKIFDDTSLELIFDEERFAFYIKEDNRGLFDFNSLSSGFSAVLDIVLDIIVRMEKVTNRSFNFDLPGIVLIDEIETHLHLDMQKSILTLLTTVFPNIQFIISTHSPFVLNSLENVVIYDLENNTIVQNGLVNVPYDGIVEGYFKADKMSDLLK